MIISMDRTVPCHTPHQVCIFFQFVNPPTGKISVNEISQKKYIGIAELKGFYFGHGDHGSGTRFNKTVEKIAEYCRVEVSKDIYNLILYCWSYGYNTESLSNRTVIK